MTNLYEVPLYDLRGSALQKVEAGAVPLTGKI
jgi:hypothetical protein